MNWGEFRPPRCGESAYLLDKPHDGTCGDKFYAARTEYSRLGTLKVFPDVSQKAPIKDEIRSAKSRIVDVRTDSIIPFYEVGKVQRTGSCPRLSPQCQLGEHIGPTSKTFP
jgi:hypothetical protein